MTVLFRYRMVQRAGLLLTCLLAIAVHPDTSLLAWAQPTNSEVSVAPPAELINGIDDITASGGLAECAWLHTLGNMGAMLPPRNSLQMCAHALKYIPLVL